MREESKCWWFAVTGEERDGSPTVREGLPLLRGSLIHKFLLEELRII